MSRHTEDSQPYRRARRAFLAANPVCWICGHPGANQLDHDPPRSVTRTNLNPANWRPAHGHPGGCPYGCGHCNQRRGTKPITQMNDQRSVTTLNTSEDW